ncbi:MAG: hypothetical protein FGF50_09225 [Candidatus Brockarchaeota archaeon]|nr:hypothetical protein [Candidatus Brockarchaeota archaeon]
MKALRSTAYALTRELSVPPLALMRRTREEEVAVGYSMIASCVMAGIIMAVARPIANWLTGGLLDNPPVQELGTMIDKLFTLLMYLGVVLLVVGLVMAGINLARRPKTRRE